MRVAKYMIFGSDRAKLIAQTCPAGMGAVGDHVKVSEEGMSNERATSSIWICPPLSNDIPPARIGLSESS